MRSKTARPFTASAQHLAELLRRDDEALRGRRADHDVGSRQPFVERLERPGFPAELLDEGIGSLTGSIGHQHSLGAALPERPSRQPKLGGAATATPLAD